MRILLFQPVLGSYLRKNAIYLLKIDRFREVLLNRLATQTVFS